MSNAPAWPSAHFCEGSLLRRDQSAVSELDPAARADGPATERPATAKSDMEGLSGLRAELQRKLAAQMDLSTPEDAPEVERINVRRPERPKIESLRAEARRSVTLQPERRGLGSMFSGRGRIRPSRLILLVVAIGAGGLAAFLATQHGEPTGKPVKHVTAQIVQPAATTQILVAKRPIGVGERLTADAIGWQDWPQNALRPEYITNAADPKAIAEMTGAIARFEFFPDEPIRKAKLALAGDGFLSAVLAHGMRGVSVPVTADSASGGFIVPDDHVDVVVTRGADGLTVSDTILRNVRVLAIDTRLGQTGSTGKAKSGSDTASEVFANRAIATLELDPAEANTIISAQTNGKLSLVLRPLVDTEASATDSEAATNAAIRLASPFWTGGSAAAGAQPAR